MIKILIPAEKSRTKSDVIINKTHIQFSDEALAKMKSAIDSKVIVGVDDASNVFISVSKPVNDLEQALTIKEYSAGKPNRKIAISNRVLSEESAFGHYTIDVKNGIKDENDAKIVWFPLLFQKGLTVRSE